MDGLRVLEFCRLRDAGFSELDAWETILRDRKLGYAKTRGSTEAMKSHRVAKSLTRFLNRAARGLVAQAHDRVKARMAAAAEGAAKTIIDLAAGEFGTGRVRVKGRGEAAYETVEIDAPAASVRLQAAKTVIGCVGVSDKPESGPAAVAAVQVTVTSPHAVADAIDRDPDLRQKAIDIAHRLGAGGQGSA